MLAPKARAISGALNAKKAEYIRQRNNASRKGEDLEAEDEAIVHVIEELSRHDGSVGWNVMIASHAAVFASYLPPQALRHRARRHLRQHPLRTAWPFTRTGRPVGHPTPPSRRDITCALPTRARTSSTACGSSRD